VNGRLWPVIRREYLERVRSRVFVVGTILGPLLMAGFMLVPALAFQHQHGKALRLAVVGAAGELQAEVTRALSERKAGDGRPQFAVLPQAAAGEAEAERSRLKATILSGDLDGYVYLPPDALERSIAFYYAKNVSNMVDLGAMHESVKDAFLRFRLGQAGVAAGTLARVLERPSVKTIKVSSAGDREDRGSSFLLSMTLMMMLYASVAMWGAALMNGVIEEKASRVVEVVVSSVPPTQLLAGKLLGVGAAGLTQFLVWVLFMAAFALIGGAAAGAAAPDIPPAVMVFFVVFFLLGYFLYGVMYAAVGAAVNSTQEAQSLVFPVMLPLMTAVMVFPAVLRSPESGMSTLMSLVPFWTPLLMFLRISTIMPPWWEVSLSLLLTLGSIIALNWVAGRIYRVGILMYGKRPTFPEILRWVRVR
jgi:ABC-2 type transport system permease protein